MRRVDRSAHRTCRPAHNTAPRRKCHFASHSAYISSHRTHETAELQKLVAMHVVSAYHVKLRQSMHKVNKIQNDQLILRHTTTDHAGLSLLLLRKMNMQPDYYHYTRAVCNYICRPQESVNAMCRSWGGNKVGLMQLVLPWSPEISTSSCKFATPGVFWLCVLLAWSQKCCYACCKARHCNDIVIKARSSNGINIGFTP